MRSRTSRTLLALWAVLAVLVVRGTLRQRRHAQVCPHVRLAQRRPRRVGLHRAVLAFVLSRLAAPWDGPIDVVEGVAGAVGGFFGSVASDVKDFVVATVKAALDGLRDIFNSIDALTRIALDGLDQLAHYAVDAIADLKGLIANVGTWVLAVARNLINDAVSLLSAAIEAVRSFAQDVGTWVWAQAQNLVHDVASWLSAAIEAVRSFAQDVGTWVWNAAQSLVSESLSALDSVLRAVISAAIDGVTAALTAVVDVVRDELSSLIDVLNHEVFGHVADVVGVVEDVIDWLIAIASFPFGAARDLWGAFRGATGRDVLDNAKGFHERHGAAAIDHARRYVS